MHSRVVGDRAEEAETIVRDLLTESGAMREGHFQLSSGLHSPHYVQCAQLLQEPENAETAGRLLAGLVQQVAPDVVVGPALGGIIIAHEVGRALDAKVFFTERHGGTMALRRGFEFHPGETVLIVEDVVTTGKSSLEVFDVVEDAGGDVVGFGCIVNRLGQDELAGRPLRSLVRTDLVTYEPGSCPLCAADTPIVKPGSRTPVQGPAC